LLAAYTELSRLAALANLNNGKLLFIKNYTSQLRYGEPTGTCKTGLAEPRRTTLPPPPFAANPQTGEL